MINTNYPINQFRKIGYRGFHNFPINNNKFTLEVKNDEVISSDVNDIVKNLEDGNRNAVDLLENFGLNYSLTEYKNGYKVKFEHEGNKYTVAYSGEPIKTDSSIILSDNEVKEADIQEEGVKIQSDYIQAPQVPNKSDYLKEVVYSNGMKETLVDENAYEQALQDYFMQKEEYENKINEINRQTAEQQKQAITDSVQNELDSFSQSLKELQTELDTSGTNSKIMTSVIQELSAEYEKLLERKKDEELKSVDYYVQDNSVPNPPIKSFYETDEEYTDALNNYTYQKFLYEKQLKEQELKIQIAEKRIKKIDEKLEQIKRLLFGNTTT